MFQGVDCGFSEIKMEQHVKVENLPLLILEEWMDCLVFSNKYNTTQRTYVHSGDVNNSSKSDNQNKYAEQAIAVEKW